MEVASITTPSRADIIFQLMEVAPITPSSATIILEQNELVIIQNALIEVLDYLDDEFQTRTGYDIHDGEQLLSFIQKETAALNGSMKTTAGSTTSATILASGDDLRLINNALNEVAHGFEIEDFDNRIGASLNDVKALLQSINDCIARSWSSGKIT